MRFLHRCMNGMECPVHPCLRRFEKPVQRASMGRIRTRIAEAAASTRRKILRWLREQHNPEIMQIASDAKR